MLYDGTTLARPAGREVREEAPALSHAKNPLNLRGLCRTCEEAEHCAFRERAEVIHHCNEYRVVESDGAAMRLALLVPETCATVDVDAAVGLCSNCQHREDCGMRRLPGGVWHCEEYALRKEA